MKRRDCDSTDRDVILEALHRVSRRAYFNRGLRELGIASAAVLLLLSGFRLSLVWIPLSTSTQAAVLALVVIGFGGSLAWRLSRRVSVARAAGIADRRGQLNDELKTAHWFLHEGRPEEPSPWIDLQIHRAAATAGELDPRRVVPMVIPGRLFLADGLLLLLAVTLWSLSWPASSLASRSPALTVGDEGSHGVAEEQPREAVEKPEESLQELEERGPLFLERGEGLDEERHIRAQSEFEKGALKDVFQERSSGLQHSEQLEKLAEAAELLRRVAESLSPEDMDELWESLEGVSKTAGPNLEQLMEDLRAAAESLQGQDLERAMASLQEAAEGLESLAQSMEAFEGMSEAGRRFRQLGEALYQQAQQAQQDPSHGEGQPRLSSLSSLSQSPGQFTEHAAFALPSERVTWQVGDPNLTLPPDESDGAPPGHATGPSPSRQRIEGEPTSLEVQLELEMLAAKEDPEDPVPEEILEQASRQQESVLDYEEVDPRADYAEEDVMSAEGIPWRYRDLVKKYFLAIRSSSER